MNAKRKEVQDYIFKHMKIIDPTGKNNTFWETIFKKMTDKDFDDWMHHLANHDSVLYIYAPTSTSQIKIDNLIKAAEVLDVRIYTRLKMWDETTQSYYTTPHKYIVLQVPVRRMAQFVDHKLSVPEGDSTVDLLTGQVMKPDKAGSLNQVEVQALYARGLKSTILELIKYRGGDVTAFASYKRELEDDGKTILHDNNNSTVRSAVVLDVLYSGLHLETNASGL